MKIKFMLGDDNRRATLDDKSKLSQVREMAAATYGLVPTSGFVLKFVDDDGDDCTLSTNEELAEARSANPVCLKIRVVIPEGAGAAIFAPKPTGASPISVGPSGSVLYELQRAKEREALERKAKEEALLTASVMDALGLIQQMEQRERREREMAELERLEEERRHHEQIEREIVERRRREESDHRAALSAQRAEEIALAKDDYDRAKAKAQRVRRQATGLANSAQQKKERMQKLEANIQDLLQMLDKLTVDSSETQAAAKVAEADAQAAEAAAASAKAALTAAESKPRV